MSGQITGINDDIDICVYILLLMHIIIWDNTHITLHLMV